MQRAVWDTPRGPSSKLFYDDGEPFAPIDIDSQTLRLTFDAAAKTAQGVAQIRFHQNVKSHPVFLLSGQITGVTLNGRHIPHVYRTMDPDRQNQLVAVKGDAPLPEGVSAELSISYTLRSNAVRFTEGGVGFLTSMSDLNPAVFFERWGPVSFEDDQFPLSLHLVLRNATSAHTLFANGQEEKTGRLDEWIVHFPSYFTASSFFVHLSNLPFHIRRETYLGMSKNIPITVYSQNESLAESAIRSLPGYFSELESDYGAYLHDGFVAYVVDSGGGMEHVGATLTSLRALSHELAHSWFARGVMPADGRSQWIDEGIVTWRDQGYPTAAALLANPPTNMGNHSHYLRGMPYYVHPHGARVMSEWELLFKMNGGLKPYLRTLFATYGKKSITTEEFRAFLEAQSGTDLGPYFRRYVDSDSALLGEVLDAPLAGEHPLPLKEAEVEALR